MFGWLKDLFTPDEPPPRRARDDGHGSAAWAGYGYRDFGSHETGVFLGIMQAPREGLEHASDLAPLVETIYTRPETNLLICAPPGTGKGTTIIIPTLLDFRQSAFVIDPKGENAAVTMRCRRDHHEQTVHVLNPWGLHGIPTSRINPLDLLDRDDINCVSNATFLADLIMVPNPGSHDRFWDESARAMLIGLMLYIVDQEPQNNNLAYLRRLATLPDREFDKIAGEMALSDAFDGALSEAGGTILGMDTKTCSNVRATVQAHTAFLADPVIKQATDRSDFSFSELKQKPTTVYVIIPAEHLGTQSRWLRLMVGMALTSIERGTRFNVRTLLMLDEFAALGRMQKIETGIATLRGYGVDFALAVQDLNQIRNIYGPAADTLLANCADKWFCRISDLNTAQLVSAMLGTATIQERSESTSHNPGQPEPSTSESWSSRARPLMMPDELLGKGPETAFLIRSGAPPIMVAPYPYYVNEGCMEWADPNPFGPAVQPAPERNKQPSEDD
ncbi:type IV secretory system conjugative DNA transfer family protein [Hyphomonas sp. UBA3201]|uniref:type IV secretory system conjugative DNA transfer family protein n=1 Tax=Hyphomonas sp. UBA3201 TaxID=1946623 RepID=UPI0025C35161|nr:type IV secretory system conjugative DNA transfer family protein [Hyphomonas sp. UBA3201]